jgi:hypothetical protein
VQSNLIQSQSGVSDALLNLWCKEKALEDLMLGIRDKDMPLPEMLKLIRGLSKK